MRCATLASSDAEALACGGCGGNFDPSQGQAGVYISIGATQLEQLDNGHVVHVCGRCAEALQDCLNNLGRAASAPHPTS